MRTSEGIAVWAGVECARVRVAGEVTDELELTGHAARLDDLDRLASLGVRAVRYPFLWERIETEPGVFDWSWADERMARLEQLGIEPIVTFLHHGAGPRWASFRSARFAARFGRYAAAFARRYPHVRSYLPINEPLTTARFAGLYGFWWPHARAWPTFVRILVAQVLAIRNAMDAVRAVNPGAILIANEDVGRTYHTPPLAEQASFDNERRWLTFDLLSGWVVPGHRLHGALARSGVGDALTSLAARPCPPDIVGIDYYVTSDRFLDHRPELYPEWARGGNGRVAYADVEAVHSRHDWTCGFGRAIEEAWRRYGRPIVLSEVQLDGDPRDQCAWWAEAWRCANEARAAGRDVRAVTAWSAFGAWEWPSLLRRRDGFYEPGAFDARSDRPVETPLARLIRRTALGAARPSRHRGWWARPERMRYGVAPEPGRDATPRPYRPHARAATTSPPTSRPTSARRGTRPPRASARSGPR